MKRQSFEYPQSIQPPEPPTFEELAFPITKGRLLLRARFPLIANPGRLHEWFGTEEGSSERTFDPRVALNVVSIQQSDVPFVILGDELPGQRAARLKTYIEFRPTEGDLAFFAGYRQLIERQDEVIECRKALALARKGYDATAQKLDGLCASDEEMLTVPTQTKGSSLSLTYKQLEALVREAKALNRGKKNPLIHARTELLRERRFAIARANGINIRAQRDGVDAAEDNLLSAINSWWTLDHIGHVKDALRDTLGELDVLGPGLEGPDGFLHHLARAITLDRGNLYSFDPRRMRLRQPRHAFVAHPLYIDLDALGSGMADENHNLVTHVGEQFVFAPYAKGAQKGPTSTMFELIGSIIVGCAMRNGGVYAIRLCPEIWRTIFTNVERLRASGIVDHLIADWGSAVISAETGKNMRILRARPQPAATTEAAQAAPEQTDGQDASNVLPAEPRPEGDQEPQKSEVEEFNFDLPLGVPSAEGGADTQPAVLH